MRYILLIIIFIVSGCASTKYQSWIGNVELDDKGNPVRSPDIVVICNRPCSSKGKKGDIEYEMDAKQANNMDEIFKNTVPLVAMKQA